MLKEGKSPEVIKENIETEINAGKKPRVAVAIALHKAQYKRKGRVK